MTEAEHTPYRPSNGTEGAEFMSEWCFQCERDREYLNDEDKGNPCEIIARTFAYNVDHQEYPKEWRYKEGRPICTAFIPAGEAVPVPPCTRTEDMFE